MTHVSLMASCNEPSPPGGVNRKTPGERSAIVQVPRHEAGPDRAFPVSLRTKTPGSTPPPHSGRSLTQDGTRSICTTGTVGTRRDSGEVV